MDRSTRFVADNLWNDLVRAFKELGILLANESGAGPQYNRLVFNEKYHLLTFEVSRDRFLNLPTSSSISSENLDRLSRHFRTMRLDVVDLGPNLYFNFWISSIGEILPANSICA
jgi:hypothetical protein